MASIREILKPDYIQLSLQSTEKNDAIRELTETLVKGGIVQDETVYLEAVMKREEETTTGIGFGVGIPHGKSSAVTEAALAFGRSQQGISYDSLDGKPVHLLFLIAVPEDSNNEHLRILSQLSRKLMHEDVRSQLMTATTAEDIYQIFD